MRFAYAGLGGLTTLLEFDNVSHSRVAGDHVGSPLRMLLVLSYSSLRADITGFVLAQIDKNRNIVGHPAWSPALPISSNHLSFR